jgi:hypothetical protein
MTAQAYSTRWAGQLGHKHLVVGWTDLSKMSEIMESSASAISICWGLIDPELAREEINQSSAM